MVKRKMHNDTLIYLRDDIIVKFGDIDCIEYTNINPNSTDKKPFDNGVKRYVVRFVKGAYFNWVIITEEDYNRLKKYFVK